MGGGGRGRGASGMGVGRQGGGMAAVKGPSKTLGQGPAGRRAAARCTQHTLCIQGGGTQERGGRAGRGARTPGVGLLRPRAVAVLAAVAAAEARALVDLGAREQQVDGVRRQRDGAAGGRRRDKVLDVGVGQRAALGQRRVAVLAALAQRVRDVRALRRAAVRRLRRVDARVVACMLAGRARRGEGRARRGEEQAKGG